MTFQVEKARKDGHTDEEILKFLSEKHPNFDLEGAKKGGYKPDEIIGFLSSYKPKPLQNPVTLKGAAGSYGSGVAGGAGGIAGDIPAILSPLQNVLPGVKALSNLSQVSGLQTTPELTETTANVLGVQQPQNALERVLQTGGEFGGQGGVIGTALGGPVGGGVGFGVGTGTGILYGALKELGVPDSVALIISALTPAGGEAALRKAAVPKSTTQKPVFKKEAPSISPKESPTGIRPGSELKETQSPYESRLNLIRQIESTPDERSLGDVISKEPFHSEAQAGRDQSREAQKLAESERIPFKEAYKQAKEVTRGHADIYPELAAENEKLIKELEEVEKRNAGQEAVYQDALTVRKLVGTPEGLVEQNAAKLVSQADSFASKVKYEEPYIGVKGKIREIVHNINKAVRDSLSRAGKNVDAVTKADRLYSEWADRFLNDEISPFLEKKNLHPESLYRKSIEDVGTYRAFKKALGSRKHPLLNKIDRDLVLKRMDKYVENPSLVNSEEYVRDLNNLSELIGKEKISEVDSFLRDRAKKFGQPTKMTPEELDKIFKNRSSIRKFKKELESKGLEKEYEKLAEDKIVELFKEEQIGSKKLTGNDIVRVLEKNREVLEELMGKDLFEGTYKEAKIAGEKEVLKERLLSRGKMAAKIGVKGAASGILGKLISLLII